MKISIIAFNDMIKCPYIKPYVEICKANDLDYEIIFFNRSGDVFDQSNQKIKPISWNPNHHKLGNFYHFAKDVIKYLTRNPSDFIIVLTTIPAVMLSNFLVKNYKGKYLVDIRDYTHEDKLPFYMLEKKVVRNSAMNVISSPGFVNFLPKAKYYLCHNVNEAYRKASNRVFVPQKEGPITIGYVGTIAYANNCIKLMQLVEKDTRFQFHLYGGTNGNDMVPQYYAEHSCDRIKMFGPYKPDEKESILKRVDILFNAYGNGRKILEYALSNKLYDSFYMQIPLLTSSETSMSEEAGCYSYDLDLNSADTLDGLYEWYHQINGEEFSRYAKGYLENVFAEQDDFYTELKRIILS